MGGKEGLAAYRRKRRFDRTEEPRGEGAPTGAEPCFVVQIHDASTLHFDFRLEVDGVLKSWSVPKGPSADPHDKRLALPTEDHPLEYREFEGVIAAGEYGAGTVIVWDRGTYRPLPPKGKRRPATFGEALERGHAAFWLDGGKLHGGYALTRFRTGEEPVRKRESWGAGPRRGNGRRSPSRTPRTSRTSRTEGHRPAVTRWDAGWWDVGRPTGR
ncbi:hypothetical protein T261_7408 [Streptomyces lydicus]|nr:hypothetical protein T261_7408 [Streptomyces lydicus]